MGHNRNIYRPKSFERGQVIFVIAAAFFGLIAFIGLAIDVGLVYIGYGHLRRATDAAALGAAIQYRKDFPDEASLNAALDASAKEYLRVNNVDLDGVSATVYTCAGGTPLQQDDSLCPPPSSTTPQRKQVKVVANGTVKTAFLAILGFDNIPISASATGESASLRCRLGDRHLRIDDLRCT